jgi:hypothetical protein
MAVFSLIDANASNQMLTNEALDPSLIKRAVESFVSGSKSTKSSGPRQNGTNKIEDVNRSFDNLKQVQDVLCARTLILCKSSFK